MKIIKVPATQKIKVPTRAGEEESEYPFARYVTECLEFVQAKTVKQVRTSDRVIRLAEAATETLALEDEDYAALKDVANPGPFIVRVARQLMPYIDAIEQAEEVKK
jgi:hypothetical protein